MKREILKLPSGRSVFCYDAVEYKYDPKSSSQRSFEVCKNLVAQDDHLLYVEGCILSGSLRSNHAWVLDRDSGVCYEFSQLPIDTEFGAKIPSEKVIYYGCEFAWQELQHLRVPALREAEATLIWDQLTISQSRGDSFLG